LIEIGNDEWHMSNEDYKKKKKKEEEW
jgi:hypothetical protein